MDGSETRKAARHGKVGPSHDRSGFVSTWGRHLWFLLPAGGLHAAATRSPTCPSHCFIVRTVVPCKITTVISGTRERERACLVVHNQTAGRIQTNLGDRAPRRTRPEYVLWAVAAAPALTSTTRSCFLHSFRCTVVSRIPRGQPAGPAMHAFCPGPDPEAGRPACRRNTGTGEIRSRAVAIVCPDGRRTHAATSSHAFIVACLHALVRYHFDSRKAGNLHCTRQREALWYLLGMTPVSLRLHATSTSYYVYEATSSS